ncbi:energy transducer TonB [Corallococcus exercitus]|uniref:TonB C-terminal domain-containing protein n=1 Tax=Corallococcus exercitus TaxID=2316736 RepID=A0A7Y4JS71_9BACT|nr:energy transducer TonB [Corallococcus exercitus]NOK10191.1 hypothetical protein [Corallococcus exercitus]
MKKGLWIAGALWLAGCASTRPVKGEAIFQCVLTHAGRAEDCQLKKREGAVSDAQVTEALHQIQAREYKPVRFNGTPVDVSYTFRFTYRDPLPTDGGVAAAPAPTEP